MYVVVKHFIMSITDFKFLTNSQPGSTSNFLPILNYPGNISYIFILSGRNNHLDFDVVESSASRGVQEWGGNLWPADQFMAEFWSSDATR